MRLGLAGLLLVFAVGSAWAADVAPPIPVTETDQLAWERYVYLEQLAEAQVANLQLRHAATVRDERAKLDDRFRRHYNLTVDQIERTPDGRFLPKQPPPPPPEKP